MMITLNHDVNYEKFHIISMYSKQSIWEAAGALSDITKRKSKHYRT